ncbi:hypothetical protein RLO149_c030000 [Roseobacter litoralis Och 149]|uniref:Uncharacterized protein n=1 Tax=Roseobacter litoralis (strain ATCC 49566 / DSM 6996 / JCM 21268 / NBRC 15278 / OCh 149) TaxID=391595 RepID=F7ZI06_ROSLO|nr:hypothetical protein RLO149_c030000 [Roseobacter litoralis Och 149]
MIFCAEHGTAGDTAGPSGHDADCALNAGNLRAVSANSAIHMSVRTWASGMYGPCFFLPLS